MGNKTKDELITEFATQFYIWMKAAGYPTEAAVAYKAGVGPATLGRILKGERGIGADVAKKVARVLGVPQIEFFTAAGLLDPNPGAGGGGGNESAAKQAAIERIMANLEQLDDTNLARVELLIRSYAGSIDATLPPITGEISLGGELSAKHIKGKGRPA